MEIKPLKPDFSIRGGAVRLKDLGYLLAGDVELDEKEVAHTVVFEWDPAEGWGGNDLNWTASAACVCDHPKEQLIVVGRMGQYFVLGQGEAREGFIGANPTSSGDPAPFRGAKSIAGRAHAVGMNGQVFCRDNADRWTALNRGLGKDDDLEAIDGFSATDLYAAGWKGKIWHYEGAVWSAQDSPTSVILTAVNCAGDGNVYVGGQAGTLLRGGKDRWEVICEGETVEDFWDLCWYQGQLYISTLHFIYRLTDKGLELVRFGGEAPSTCQKLSTRDGVLWSIGQWDVMAYDGKKWTRIS